MARWTPVVYTRCTRCDQVACSTPTPFEERPLKGRAVRVVVHGRPGCFRPPAKGATPAPAGAPGCARPPSRSALREIGSALPFLLLGAAVILLAGLERHSR